MFTKSVAIVAVFKAIESINTFLFSFNCNKVLCFIILCWKLQLVFVLFRKLHLYEIPHHAQISHRNI